MRTEQLHWTASDGWRSAGCKDTASAQLVLFFGAREALESGERFRELRARFPAAHIMGCSTGGEILDEDVLDDTVVATAVAFRKTGLNLASATVEGKRCSAEIGRELGKALAAPDLRGVFVLSDGTRVNGSALVSGLVDLLPADVSVTGGLAGDAARFDTTLVSADCEPAPGRIAALGLYGASIEIGHGSLGGWDDFGPQHIVTRADDNILYELDGRPALELYKTYLGEEAENLRGAALLYPLKVRANPEADNDVVRTIVGIDETENSITFAGNIFEGSTAQLMRANFENLIDGAASAAELATANGAGHGEGDRLAILISCIGRKLVLGQRTGEEVEAVRDALGGDVPQLGFYSYGEISPHSRSGMCELHNQTMTITVLAEH